MKCERSSFVDFGAVAFVKDVESFCAKGLRITNQQKLAGIVKERYETEGLILIDIPANYKDNVKWSTIKLPDAFNS